MARIVIPLLADVPFIPGIQVGWRVAGWFSRRAYILCELWVPGSVRRPGSLDDQTFAAMWASSL